ncbi:MAG: SH3 domain-containing protein [Actinomycetota bacterium]
MVRRARNVILVGLIAVIATACGGGSNAPAARSSSPTASPSPSPTKPALAGEYVVSAAGCLNIRQDPGLKATVVTCAPSGSVVRADGASRKNAGYTWLHVTYKGFSGWAASTYLSRRAGGASPSPSASA